MHESLLKRYREYARTEEALAVLFVKRHLAQAKGHWVDVHACRRYEMSSDAMHFRFVEGGLFRRHIQPHYPPRSEYTFNGKFDEHAYALVARALTWETAHKDIEQQKAKRIEPLRFEIKGVSYDKNRGAKVFSGMTLHQRSKRLQTTSQTAPTPYGTPRCSTSTSLSSSMKYARRE